VSCVSAESGQLLLSPDRCSGEPPTSERLCPEQPECVSEVQPQQAGRVVTRHEDEDHYGFRDGVGEEADERGQDNWRTGDWSEVSPPSHKSSSSRIRLHFSSVLKAAETASSDGQWRAASPMISNNAMAVADPPTSFRATPSRVRSGTSACGARYEWLIMALCYKNTYKCSATKRAVEEFSCGWSVAKTIWA